jgi:hypothetical protein
MITPQEQELLSLSGWVKQFHEVVIDCDTMMEAYEILEGRHERAFGKRRYSDFKSFTDCYYRFKKQNIR